MKVNSKNKFKFLVCFTYLIGIFLGLTACSQKDNTNNVQVIIKMPERSSGLFTLKNYVDSTIYVKLETPVDGIIGRINRISIFDDKLFIHDSKSKSLFVFDMSGRFLYKIHRVGMGPEEYNSFTSFCIDRLKKLVLIHDLSKNAIYKYSTNNGNFKDVVRIKERKSFARDISVLDNGDFLCYSSEKQSDAMCGIWVLNKNGDFKKNLWEQTEVYPVIPTDPNPVLIKQLKDSLYSVFDVVNNIIYHYDGSNFTKMYLFDFSHTSVTPVSLHPGITNMKRSESKIKDVIEIAGIQETNNYIWTEWACNGNSIQTFYLKNEKKNIYADKCEFIDGILGMMIPTDNSDIICFNIGAWECADILAKDKKNEIGARVKQLMSKTKPDDNPIIQIYYMKK